MQNPLCQSTDSFNLEAYHWNYGLPHRTLQSSSVLYPACYWFWWLILQWYIRHLFVLLLLLLLLSYADRRNLTLDQKTNNNLSNICTWSYLPTYSGLHLFRSFRIVWLYILQQQLLFCPVPNSLFSFLTFLFISKVLLWWFRQNLQQTPLHTSIFPIDRTKCSYCLERLNYMFLTEKKNSYSLGKVFFFHCREAVKEVCKIDDFLIHLVSKSSAFHRQLEIILNRPTYLQVQFSAVPFYSYSPFLLPDLIFLTQD